MDNAQFRMHNRKRRDTIKVQVIRTYPIYYNSEGGEVTDPAAFAACIKLGTLREEEAAVVVFEAEGKTYGDIEMAIWSWCAAQEVDFRELELAEVLRDGEEELCPSVD